MQYRLAKPVTILTPRDRKVSLLGVHDAEEILPRFRMFKPCQNEGFNLPTQGLGCIDAIHRALFQSLHIVIEYGLVDLGLGAEIEVYRPLGDARLFGDLVD